MMETKEYLTQVENILNQMNERQLKEWIYAQARIGKLQNRKAFISSLAGKEIKSSLNYDEIMEWCRKIDDEEIYFEAEEYEYYPEGGWESDYEVIYKDPFKIGNMIDNIFDLGFSMMMCKKYEHAFRLFECILNHHFRVYHDEFGYDDALTIVDLDKEDLIKIDMRIFKLTYLYLLIQSNHGQDLFTKIYHCFLLPDFDDRQINDVICYGPEKIDNENEFIQNWYNFLLNKTEKRAAELLIDACIYLKDEDYLLETAQKSKDLSGYLYQEYCNRKYSNKEYLQSIEAAKKAIKQIDKKEKIRSIICDTAYQAAAILHDDKDMKYFSLEAFISEPTGYRLMQLYQSSDTSILETALSEIKTNNNLSKDDQLLYMFMLKEIDPALEKCKEDHHYLGWRNNFKGIILPLLLLLLKKHSSHKTKAEQTLMNEIKGRLNCGNDQMFEEAFPKMKEHIQIDDEKRKELMMWIFEEIERRCESILAGNYRNSYYKPAVLIIVLSHILYEQGDTASDDYLIHQYKERYSRRRAFISELNSYKI